MSVYACPFRLVLTIAVVGVTHSAASADCAPFYDSLNNPGSIEHNGGVIVGDCDFAPGVNSNAIVFDGDCYVQYSSELFSTEIGSVSLWFRKSLLDTDGGIFQIGTLGTANSIGLFFHNTDLSFEVRNASNQLTQIRVPGLFSEDRWVHIVAMWKCLGNGCDMWLFIDGIFGEYAHLDGNLNLTTGNLRIGHAAWYEYAEGMMDELRVFDWDILDSEVYAEYVYSANKYHKQLTTKPASTGNVQVIGERLLVNGQPFQVKGVGYQPTPIGSWPASSTYADPCIIARDIPLLRGMNVNTIRLWSEPPDNSLLDACYNSGENPIYVIMGFWIDSNVDYSDPVTAAGIKCDFCNYVEQFKDHPAVLAWGIGNENNLAYGGEKSDWFALANELALLAYAQEEPNYHPAVVVNGGMHDLGNVDCKSDDASLDYVDMWGVNAYPGDDFHCYFDYYGRLSAKPLVITEYGIDAWDYQHGCEYQQTQAEYAVQQWRQIEAACVGATIMAYSDEWWKWKYPNSHDLGGQYSRVHPDGYCNEEWWGMVWVERGVDCDIVHPRQAYYAMMTEYANVDYDQDGDADLHDFAVLFAAMNGPNQSASNPISDLDHDGDCDLADYAMFAVRFTGQFGDVDGDGDVDLDDLAELVAAMNGPEQPPAHRRADLDGDGDSDLADFAIFAKRFGG